MAEMSYRQRVLRTMQFKEVDALPFRHAYGTMPGVLEEWYQQGLPTWVKTKADEYKYFGFAPRAPALPLRVGPTPGFESKVLFEDDEYRVAIDGWGRKVKTAKKVASLPVAMEFPVKDMDTWQDYKRRLQFSPDRVGENLEAIAREHGGGFGSMGFYWFPRDLMGDEGLCIAYYEQPELVHDILETWCSLIEQILKAALQRVKLDGIHFGEDMAYRNASMVSKETFDEFIRPYYKRMQKIKDQYEIPFLSVDSDGCFNELIDWFIECDVNVEGPNEVQAGNDIVAYRKRLGRKMGYDGGLDKRVLTQGRGAIDEMLERAIPYMKETGGGWSIALDHRVIPGTKLADFQYYCDRSREMAKF